MDFAVIFSTTYPVDGRSRQWCSNPDEQLLQSESRIQNRGRRFIDFSKARFIPEGATNTSWFSHGDLDHESLSTILPRNPQPLIRDGIKNRAGQIVKLDVSMFHYGSVFGLYLE